MQSASVLASFADGMPKNPVSGVRLQVLGETGTAHINYISVHKARPRSRGLMKALSQEGEDK